ncbi:hypothetical protein Tco_0615290 [Tanacetum coccineum]
MTRTKHPFYGGSPLYPPLMVAVLGLPWGDSDEWNSGDDQLRFEDGDDIPRGCWQTLQKELEQRLDLSSIDKRKAQSGKRSSKELSDKRRKPLEFLRVGDWSTIECVALEGRSAFLKEGLPEELSSVHDTFHVSNLKKCLADANLHVPLNEIKIDKTLRFVEELVEIMDHEIRNLKRSRYHL